jgi:hypothetical protein
MITLNIKEQVEVLFYWDEPWIYFQMALEEMHY